MAPSATSAATATATSTGASSHVITSPHPDITIPDCSLPHLLLSLNHEESIDPELLSKPICFPAPSSSRGWKATANGNGNGLADKLAEKLHIGSAGAAESQSNKARFPQDAAPITFDTWGPLSLLQLRELADRVAISLLTSSSSSPAKNDLPTIPAWKKGDVVAFFSTNQHDYCAAVMGVQIAGGIAALCNPAYKPRELAHQLRMTQASIIITSIESYTAAVEAAQLASSKNYVEEVSDTAPPIAPPIVLVFEEDHPASWLNVLLAPRKEAWEKRAETIAKVQISPEKDTAIYCFSSGTSGLPKALSLTHRNLVANVLQFHTLMVDEFYPPVAPLPGAGPSAPQPPRKEHKQHFHIDFLPCFHAYGLQCVFVALYSATPRVLLSRFKLDTFLQLSQEHKATFAFVVPPVLLALAKSPEVEKYDLSAMKHVASGAATLSQELAAQVKKRLGIIVTDGYGMSEMSPIVCLQNVDDAKEAPDTVGFLAPNTRARIVGPDGKDVPAGQEGEIYLQGPQMMTGYLNNKEGNEAAFTSTNRFDPDCWLRTGDVAKATPEGRLCITGRTKDLIKYSGFQVSPKELEDLLYKEDAVADAAVVGIVDEHGAELPWAFLVAPPNVKAAASKESEEEQKKRTESIIQSINSKVAGYKKIRGITWLDALPKSASGKVLKRELKDISTGKAQA